ncbi:MAG: Clp protease N-terminal domain-containing protein [Nocardioidaceae bacterium]
MPRWLPAVVGEDGTAVVWPRLNPESREIVRLAFAEAQTLGHPCLADEHLLLGLLRQGRSQAAAVLRAGGLDVTTARSEILRLGPTIGPSVHPANALRVVGIDLAHVREQMEATFGTQSVDAAERRVRRRPRWRGGHPRPSPLCYYLLAKRALELAARSTAEHGDGQVTPEHLLYGVLQDAQDPVGTQLSRRSRRELATLGFTPGKPNPVRLQLQAHGLDLERLANDLGTPR